MMLTSFLAALLLQAAPAPAPAPHAMPGEEAVDPYTVSDANAGARQFTDSGMADAFHGQPGIRRIVERLVALSFDDKVIGEVFKDQDRVRITRGLYEQFCYILNAGCSYTGRDMVSSHKDLGVQQGDLNRLVELLQVAMREEGVGFQAQNRFLSKLAPMRHQVVTR